MSILAETSFPTADTYQIAARLERLPYSSWHRKMRIVLGTAFLFDAFDSLLIAYVLPVLIPLWHLTPGQTGNLIAIGAVGQLLGSIGFGWLAEKIGRTPVMIMTLLIFTAMSLACVGAWGYQAMLWLRFFQGLGLGGEIPIMVAYINEFAKAKDRARFSLAYQLLFPTGLVLVALVGVWVVPNLGWKWMFIIGAAQALLSSFFPCGGRYRNRLGGWRARAACRKPTEAWRVLSALSLTTAPGPCPPSRLTCLP